MKNLHSLGVFLFLLFPLFPAEPSNEVLSCTEEEEIAVTTIIRICTFHFLSTGGVGECDATTLTLEISDCIGEGAATVKVANLHPNPVIGSAYDLPPAVPSIYYEYKKSGESVTIIGPIRTFNFDGEYFQTDDGGHHPIFEYNSTMKINVEEECVGNPVPNIPIDVRLIKKTGELYPIDDYVGSDQIFYCKLFSETCDECSTVPRECTGGSLPVYHITGCGECAEGCARSSGEDSSGNEISDIVVQPNPFSNTLNIRYALEKESAISLEIIDSKGSLTYKAVENQLEGAYSLRIDTENIPSGVYFVRIKMGSTITTQKIVKLN